MAQQVFRRTEIKYLLNPEDFSALMEVIRPCLCEDKYFKSTNCSLYFDSSNNYLAIHSLESPLYKEKVRLRSYGVPNLNDTVFLELKKKYDGIGNKRRIPVKLKDFYTYLKNHEKFPKTNNPQIENELHYAFTYYNLRPRLFLAYDRTSYVDKDNPLFRVTFDKNIRSRENDLYLESGDYGKNYFQNNEIVMEVKATDHYPLWFSHALSKSKIYPAKFSKYGKVMQKIVSKEENV